MKLGTLIRVLLGEDEQRIATVVYHGLDGYGAKWGGYKLTDEDVALINSGGPMGPKPPEDFQWFPDVMLDDVEWEVLPTLPSLADTRKALQGIDETKKKLARLQGKTQQAIDAIKGAAADVQKIVDEQEGKRADQ